MPFIDDVVDAVTPSNTPLTAKYKRSFAYTTVQERLPIILTQVIDHLARDKAQIAEELGEEIKEELKAVIGSFSKLKNELQTNKSLALLTSGGDDVDIWNNYLEELQRSGTAPRWFSCPWLYVECYMYRRCWEIFEKCTYLKSFDPFRKKKRGSLSNSLAAITELANYLHRQLQRTNEFQQVEIKRELLKWIHVNLWGNRCDLSISSGDDVIVSEDPMQKIQELNSYILVDDSNMVWETLTNETCRQDTVIDMVLDNAGYELFTDLCLADFLCTFSLVGRIRFHVKAMPWYVSDTLPVDLQWLLQTLASFKESSSLPVLTARWETYLQSGKWTVQAETFWTLPHDYSKMKIIDCKLYNTLSEAVLIIFKGDLNYRKLVGDINWDPTELFANALRGFCPTKLVTLRTVKADVICGLASGQAAAVAAQHADWLTTGQYAVIQFHG